MIQYRQTYRIRGRNWLKPVSAVFILAEALDIATTFWGIAFFPQVWEANPLYILLGGWTFVILAKILATALVVWVLEKVERWPDLVWLIPFTAFLPVVWNMVCLLAEMVV